MKRLDEIADATNPSWSLDEAASLAAPLVLAGKVNRNQAATRITERWGLPELKDSLAGKIRRREEANSQVSGDSGMADLPARTPAQRRSDAKRFFDHADPTAVGELLADPEVREKVTASLADSSGGYVRPSMTPVDTFPPSFAILSPFGKPKSSTRSSGMDSLVSLPGLVTSTIGRLWTIARGDG